MDITEFWVLTGNISFLWQSMSAPHKTFMFYTGSKKQ